MGCEFKIHRLIKNTLNGKPWFDYNERQGYIQILDSPKLKIDRRKSFAVSRKVADAINKQINDGPKKVGEIAFPVVLDNRGAVEIIINDRQINLLNAIAQEEIDLYNQEADEVLEELRKRQEFEYFEKNAKETKTYLNEYGDVVTDNPRDVQYKKTPSQPTEEQLKYVKPLPKDLLDNINTLKDKSNEEILTIIKDYTEANKGNEDLVKVVSILLKNSSKIKFVKFKGIAKLENPNNQAEYDGKTGEIFVNNIAYQPDNSNVQQDLYETIIHEYLHGFFLSVLNSPKTKEEIELVDYIKNVYEILKEEYTGTEKHYGYTNIHEFVSELLSNKNFRESEQVKKTGVIQKIVQFINSLMFKSLGKNSIEIKENSFNKILNSISILNPSLVEDGTNLGSISKLFEQNTELANSVYEAMGFDNKQELENLKKEFSSFSNIKDKFKGDLKNTKNLVDVFTQIASDANFRKPFANDISEQRKKDIILGKATTYIFEDNFDSYRKTIEKSLKDELESEKDRFNHWFDNETSFYTLDVESGKYYKYASSTIYTPLEKKYEITKKEYYEDLENYKESLEQKNLQEQEDVKENVLRQPFLEGKIVRLFDNHFIIVTDHTITEKGDSFVNEIQFIYYDEFNYDRLQELKNNQITQQQKQQAQIAYSNYLESLNKLNTNPVLQGNQQEQLNKFKELQEKLNNKEFLEGAKFAYESGESLKDMLIVDTEDIITQEGTKGAASYNRTQNTIKVNRNLLKLKFEEKAWAKPRKLTEILHGEKIESYAQALPENQFKTYEEWEQFVINHEYQHSLYSRKDFDIEFPNKTKGDYESEINSRAINQQAQSLKDFGTQEQYNDYIARVSLGIVRNPSSGEFNNSAVEDIVYHDTDFKFDEFKSKRGIYFNTSFETGFSNSLHKIAALINLKNPAIEDMDSYGGKNTNDEFKNNDGVIGTLLNGTVYGEYIVSKPEQIHILNSKQDIEGFKEFVEKENDPTLFDIDNNMKFIVHNYMSKYLNNKEQIATVNEEYIKMSKNTLVEELKIDKLKTLLSNVGYLKNQNGVVTFKIKQEVLEDIIENEIKDLRSYFKDKLNFKFKIKEKSVQELYNEYKTSLLNSFEISSLEDFNIMINRLGKDKVENYLKNCK